MNQRENKKSETKESETQKTKKYNTITTLNFRGLEQNCIPVILAPTTFSTTLKNRENKCTNQKSF